MEIEEEAEVVLAKKGDLDSFNRIVERYRNRAFGLSLRMLGEREEALDAIQDSFLKAWMGIKKFRGGNFRSWLLSIVANSCRNRLKKRNKEYVISLEEVDIASSLPSPEEEALGKELRAEIQNGLLCIPFEERLAVTLFDIQGFSYKEITQVMGCPLGTVKSRLSLGRRKLRDYLLKRGVVSPKHHTRDEVGND
jgi:RNA polymerase sigma-70 factor (ECF subfamily)